MYQFKRGQTSVILRVKLLDSSLSTGAGKTGLSNTSAGLIIAAIASNEAATIAYRASASPTEVETIATLGTYAAPSANCCRFKEVDATNHPGLYEIQLADARFAVSSAKHLVVSVSGASNLAQRDVIVFLTDLDPYDSAAAGLSRLDTTVGSRASQTSVDTIDDFIDSEVGAIKTQTDKLTFDGANNIAANIKKVNDVAVTGTGASGDEWGP